MPSFMPVDELGLASPYEPGSPEDQQYRTGMLRGAVIPATNAPIGALSMVLPARQDEQGNVQPAAPGFLSGLYGLAGSVAPNLINAGLSRLGIRAAIPEAPGAREALTQAGQTEDLAARIIPHMEAQTPDEQAIQTGARVGGSALVPIPGSAIESVAGKLAPVAKFLVPNLEGATKAAPVLAVGGTALEGYAQGKEAQAAQLEKQLTDQNQDQGGPHEINLNLTDGGPTYGSHEVNLNLGGPPQAPTFDQTGQSQTPFYETAAEIAMAGIGAWLALRHGGKAWTALSDAARTGDLSGTATEVRNAAYNTDLASAQSTISELTGGKPGAPLTGEAPLPGTAGTPGTRTAQAWWDRGAVPNRYMEAAAPPDMAEQFSAASGTINNSQSQSRRIKALFDTGIDSATGQSMPSVTRWAQGIQQLEPGAQNLLNTALHAADELDNRVSMLQDYMSSGEGRRGTGPLPDLRFNFKNQSSDDLRYAIYAANQVPEIKTLLDTAWQIGKRNLDIALQRGYITDQDYALILKEHPHYIPTVDADGRVTNILGPRDLTPGAGWESPPTYAWSALIQHQDQLFRDMAKNEWLRTIVLQGQKFQDDNPNMAQVFREKLGGDAVPPKEANDPASPARADRAITIRTASGQRTFYVNNTDMYNALRGPPAQLNMMTGVLSGMRRTLQAGVTGPLSAIGGRAFAPIALARNILQVPIDRTPGTYGGLIDRALQRATGGKAAYRFIDPTTPFAAIGSGAADAISHTIKNLADAFRDKSNLIAMPLRAAKGDQWMNAAADRLDALYASSNAAKMAQAGIGGTSGWGGVEMPTMVLKSKSGGAQYVGRNPIGSSAPGIMGEATLPFTNVRVPTTLSHTYVNLRSMIRDSYDAVTSGMHSYYYRLNADNPGLVGNQLAHEVQQVVGDPGIAGASKAAHYWGAAVPFSNISLQDINRMTRVFRDSPLSFTSGLIGSLALPALGSIYSAMVSGPDHVKHLEDEMSTSSRAGNLIFYHGQGTDPNDHTEISLPQRFRPLYAAILELTATAVNAFQAHGDQGLLERTLDTIGDVFDHHLSNSTVMATQHGVSDLLSFPMQLPPAATLPLALAGKTQNTSLDDVVEQLRQGHGITGSLFKDVTSQRTAPGTGRFDGVLSNDDGKSMVAILSSLFGNVGQAWNLAHNFSERSQFPEQDMPIHGLIDDYLSSLSDKNPIGNFIWGKTLQQTTRTPLAESTQRSVDAIHQTAGAVSGLKEEGFTRAGGLPILPLSKPNVPSDPTMAQLYATTSRFDALISKQYMPMINDIRKQIANIQEGPLSAETKRTLLNGLAKQEQLRWGQIAGVVANLNSGLSAIVGKHVNVNNIDWKRGPDQFNSED